MSELLNEQYNNVFSTPDPTMTIKYPKDFFGHLQGNTLSDINITREDIEAIQRTITYKIAEVQHLKLLGKTARTHIMLSPEMT